MGLSLCVDVQALSEPIRDFVRRLDESPLVDREKFWSEHLATLPAAQADDLIESVAAANPDDPAPDEDWGQPRLYEMPPVLPFPLDVYPAPVARLIIQAARAIGCPADHLGLNVLAVAGAAIGRSASLMLKEGYFVSASVYGLCIAPPGVGKSPALNIVAKPFQRIDADEYRLWRERMDDFERLQAEYEAAKKAAKRRPAGNSDSPEEKEAPTNVVPLKPTQPVLRRTVVIDTTVEGLVTIMQENPRGLLMALDEAVSLLTSMNQYKGGKGSDRQFYLSVWSGQSYIVDRKGNEAGPIRVPHPFLSIIGAMVPDMLGEPGDSKGRHDGFTDRFLVIYPDPISKAGWREEGVAKEVEAEWAEIIHRLLAMPMLQQEGQADPHPRVVRFSDAAKQAWCAMIDAHHDEQNQLDFPQQALDGPWAKLDQYAGRIPLILHLLHEAADPTSDPAKPTEIPLHIMKKTARLLEYFKNHTRRVQTAMRSKARGEEGNDDVQVISKWLLRHRPVSFSLRDLTRDLSRTFGKRPHALDEALAWLSDRNHIRLQVDPKPPAGRPGRRRTRTYLVNPHLLWSQNRQFGQGALAVRDQDRDSGNNGDSATTTPSGEAEEAANDLLHTP